MSTEPIAAGPNDVTVMPCPFCGSHDVAVKEGETYRWRLVVCNCCGAAGPDVRIQTAGSGTNEEWERRATVGAVAEWNKRHNTIVVAFGRWSFKPTGALERAPRFCRAVCASAPVTAVCPFRFAHKRARTRSEQSSRFRSYGKQGGMPVAALCGWRDTLPPYLISGAPWRSEKGRRRALMGKRIVTYAALAACSAPLGARGHESRFDSLRRVSACLLVVLFGAVARATSERSDDSARAKRAP